MTLREVFLETCRFGKPAITLTKGNVSHVSDVNFFKRVGLGKLYGYPVFAQYGNNFRFGTNCI